MTKSETNLFKMGNRCHVCTGCGRCFGEKQVHTVCEFVYPHEVSREENTAVVQNTDVAQKDGLTPEYLVAVDIGTTTIAMQLREMASGKVADVYTCTNPQRSFGADVLSRIEAAGDSKAREEMRQQVLEVLRKGLEQFAEKFATEAMEKSEKCFAESTKGIKGMAIAANTTMIHFLMGYAVDGLGKYPFTPKTVAEVRTKLFDLDTVILPGVSAFVGADVMAGVYALSMQEREKITLLVDLGTNGEMVLGNRECMVATSAAAGPAFERGGEFFGTDLIKQVAALLEDGILDETGLLQEPYFSDGILVGGVQITQDYIRQLQMAKSAICGGICILCEKYGLKTMDEIEEVYLAGGMGQYLDVQAAVAIGLLPEAVKAKTFAVGNAALEGAYLYGREVFSNHGSVVDKRSAIKECNLAKEEKFADYYISGMELAPCIEC